MNETNALLAELVKWTKVTSYENVKRTLESALVTPEQRMVYNLSDGSRTGLQIAKESGVNNAKVSTLQSRWAKMGLLVKNDGAYHKQFELDDFDIEIGGPKSDAKRK
jgi:hypothetical protein